MFELCKWPPLVGKYYIGICGNDNRRKEERTTK